MRIYVWKEEGTFWLLPYMGFSWAPERSNCFFCGWVCWVLAIYFDGEWGSYIHVHKAKENYGYGHV